MKKRYLSNAIETFCFTRHKIAMVSGPRQCGKTTLAKALLKRRRLGEYYNWDEYEFRRRWTEEPSTIIPTSRSKKVPMIILDEIHKDRFWKRNLKGLYDTLEKPCDILVTGSARLNVYRKGSDSMMGRYFHFRLHPFSLREMDTDTVLRPDDMLEALFNRSLSRKKHDRKNLDALMRYGPFPEPLFEQDDAAVRMWRRTREITVIREDLRDISRLPDLGRIEMMTTLLPARIGSLLSVASLQRDMETTIPTIKRWLAYLKELFYLFEIKPYHGKIPRSLRREGKIYFWDFGMVKDEAARFENMVACHLKKTCDFWTDTGEGEFDLCFLRNKDKQEIDFLIVRDGVPWLPVEVKLSDTKPSQNWKPFASVLPCKHAIQIVNKPHWNVHKFDDESQLLIADAPEVLKYFI